MNIFIFNKFAPVLLLMIIYSSINILATPMAQDDKQINEFVTILKQKVLLNRDQETGVFNILSDLNKNIASQPENKEEFLKAAKSKIESLLDNKQKMKYDIIKNDLWKKIS